MNQSTPLFSILIANYNNGQYLQQCIDSILAQSYTNWEIIIVDDASNDIISQKIYNKYNKDSRFTIVSNQTNRGCGYTKRKCVKMAKGEICGFVDPDDAITKEALEVMVNEHNYSKNLSLIYSTHYICNSNLEIEKIADYVGLISKKESYLSSNSNKVSHFASFKRKLYFKSSGIDANLEKAIDQDLYFKLEEVGNIKFINKPLYLYRIHDFGISQFKNNIEAQLQFVKIQKRAFKRRLFNKSIKVKNINFILLAKKELIVNNAMALQLFKKGEIAKMYMLLLKNSKLFLFDYRFLILRMAILPLKQYFTNLLK
ncbi:glycosyltransferase [Plebeiibacterium sediminum]|uniref:Glycosyltransferase n=1 Tax=Plebeiibacterium sediminum TaxID=2992112 RepID=A0AAE3M8I0_9BACT|nr:glycosyltransferase [Plebeiobacterium sediminum]MCW3789194.1 glycosyltransferase [Plebeiobacterium sediminum]